MFEAFLIAAFEIIMMLEKNGSMMKDVPDDKPSADDKPSCYGLEFNYEVSE